MLQEIRDSMDLMPLPAEEFPWLLVIAAVVAVIAIGVWVALLLRRRRRPREKGTPEKAAYRGLDALSGGGRQLYVGLSIVFAAYLHRRLHLNATSMTSAEVLESVPAHVELEAEATAALQRFLDLCDTGKFGPADCAATDDAIAACREAIRQIALAALTKPRVARAAEETHAAV